MSHIIYYSAIEDKLFLLEQLAHGSKETIQYYFKILRTKKNTDYEVTEFDLEMMRYKESIYSTVSDYLIQCATRTRIMQDMSDFSTDDPHYSPDNEAFNHFDNVAEVIDGKVNLSLRECCNKIIHAAQLELVFLKCENMNHEYWSGDVILLGKYNGINWKIRIDIKKWVLSMKYYLDTIKNL